MQYQKLIVPKLALLVRGDTLPLGWHQGLYDFLIGVEEVDSTRQGPQSGGGLRLFWGGYTPRIEGKNNNEIFFIGPVLRLKF
jgi:hypothetical protein